MSVLLIIGSAYALVLVTWVLYLAIMNLAPRRAEMHPVVRVHAYALLAIGYPLDVLLNGLVCLVMWRRPQDWTLTYTLKRIQNTEPNDSWRCIAATWFCTYFLNPFDAKGRHC